MRIISQYEYYDLNYDECSIMRNDDTITAIQHGEPRMMGQYDSVEEAKAALRQMWIQYKRLDGKAGIFKFPKLQGQKDE